MQMITRSLLFVALFFSFLSIQSQSNLVDSLQRILPQLQSKERMRVLGDLCWEMSGTDAIQAEKYGRELMTMATALKDSTEVAEAANLLVVALYRKGDYEEALRYNRRAYAIRKKAGDPKAIGSTINKFVNIFVDQVRLDSALKYGLEGVEIYESRKDTANWAISLNNIASIYQKDRDFKSCLSTSQKAYDLSSAIGFSYAQGGAAGNMGASLENLGSLDEALQWYEKAKIHFTEAGSDVDLGTVANNVGVIYRKQKKFDLALINYRIAFDMATRIGASQSIGHASVSLGQLLTEMNRASEGEPYLREGVKIAERENLNRLRIVSYTGLVECLAKQGKGQEAADYLGKYMALQDSLYNTERSELLQDMRTKYDTEKKERENEYLKQENELKEREKTRIQIGSAIIITLILIGAYLYYINYKRKQREAMQREIIRERERGLLAVFDATEEERKRIAKDLHDGIGQQLSGLKLSWDGLQSKISNTNNDEAERLRTLTSVLDEACTEVRTISHQMMPKSLQEGGILPALQDMLRKSLGLTSISYKIEHFKVEGERFDERVEIGLYRISQELINNIIKHSGATEVAVQLYRNKNSLILMIEDNGKGFDPLKKRDGIGLMNISSRLSTVSGDVVWEPGPESGTVATIRIPIAD
jgi:signal transduction histidine kinase